MLRALIAVAVLTAAAVAQQGRRPPRVPAAATRAIAAFLAADEGERDRALDAAVAACKGKVETGIAALRALPPLTKAGPGTEHGLEFTSGGETWEYSIRLPRRYDGERRFPVLVLPDHGAVGAEAGIAFWEQSDAVEEFVLFRPVIVRFADDEERFPRRQFFDRCSDVAAVMRDALRHLRLHYAVDHDRLFMTGLSQAGFYTWLFAAVLPDEFAGIVPESAGGAAVLGGVLPLAANLAGLHVEILHARGDQICPFEHAERMRAAIAAAGGAVELVAFDAGDYPSPNPRQHPVPHHERLARVLPWCAELRREPPREVRRVVRYPAQGVEHRFVVAPPPSPTAPFELRAKADDGELECSVDAVYLVSPEDAERPRLRVHGERVKTPKGDLRTLLSWYRRVPDPARLVVAELEVGGERGR